MEGLDNWRDIESYFESAARDETFIVPLDADLPKFNNAIINYENLASYPVDIQNYYREVVGYNEFNSGLRYINDKVHIVLLKDAGADFETYNPEFDVDIGNLEEVFEKTLEMLSDQYGCVNPDTTIRVAELEEFYEIHRNR